MFNFNSIEEILPPCKPGLEEFENPRTGIPSFHHDNFAGGLLELESQISVASIPGTKSVGSRRIFTCSGGTAKIST